MPEIRTIRPEEIPAAIQLADATFNKAGGKSMGDIFPTVFSPAFRQSYGAFVDEQLVSFIGFVPNLIRIGEAAIRTYSIGAVCTATEHRGNGYAGMILDAILLHMKKARSPLLLVSGLRSLYSRIGCLEFGITSYHLIHREALAGHDALSSRQDARIREFQAEDWFSLHQLAQKKTACYEQSVWDLATLIHAEAPAANAAGHNVVLVAENPLDGELRGFIIFGCPNPENGVRADLLAWGGDSELILALIAEALHRYPFTEMQVHVPWHETELIQQLDARTKSYKEQRKNQGTALIADAELFIRQLRPYLNSQNKRMSDRFQVKHAEDGVEISLAGVTHRLSREAFSALVFDGQFPEAVAGDAKQALSAWFPLPFPYTGGINYV